MCEIGEVEKLDHITNSPWTAPDFVQPKKTGGVQVLTDLREVNKQIEWKPFPLLRINYMIQKIEKFNSAMALDSSQGYYCTPIDKESGQICTTILPWGNYAWKRLHIGPFLAPDVLQSLMVQYLDYLNYVLISILLIEHLLCVCVCVCVSQKLCKCYRE